MNLRTHSYEIKLLSESCHKTGEHRRNASKIQSRCNFPSTIFLRSEFHLPLPEEANVFSSTKPE